MYLFFLMFYFICFVLSLLLFFYIYRRTSLPFIFISYKYNLLGFSPPSCLFISIFSSESYLLFVCLSLPFWILSFPASLSSSLFISQNRTGIYAISSALMFPSQSRRSGGFARCFWILITRLNLASFVFLRSMKSFSRRKEQRVRGNYCRNSSHLNLVEKIQTYIIYIHARKYSYTHVRTYTHTRTHARTHTIIIAFIISQTLFFKLILCT